jgi:hypothetical protein
MGSMQRSGWVWGQVLNYQVSSILFLGVLGERLSSRKERKENGGTRMNADSLHLTQRRKGRKGGGGRIPVY